MSARDRMIRKWNWLVNLYLPLLWRLGAENFFPMSARDRMIGKWNRLLLSKHGKGSIRKPKKTPIIIVQGNLYNLTHQWTREMCRNTVYCISTLASEYRKYYDYWGFLWFPDWSFTMFTEIFLRIELFWCSSYNRTGYQLEKTVTVYQLLHPNIENKSRVMEQHSNSWICMIKLPCLV
jgi:hypothetical protein